MGKMSVHLNATAEKMTLALKHPQGIAAQIIFPTKEASSLAGHLLEAARVAYQLIHKQPPHRTKDEKVSLTVVTPSGHNVAPGRKPTSTMMVFSFGETVLGIELPNADAQVLARRLMTSSADEGTAQ